MTGKILVAIDGSKQAEYVMEYSARLAKGQKLDVILLNVLNTSIVGTHHWMSIKDKLEEELEGQAREIVTKGKEFMTSRGINAEGIIREGLPYEEIVNAAKSHEGVEAVVLGAYGKNFFERRMIGSQTEKVLRLIGDLCIPLIVVPAAKSCETE